MVGYDSKHITGEKWIYYNPDQKGKVLIVHTHSPSYCNREGGFKKLYEDLMREIEDHLPKCVLGKFDEGKLKDLLDEINYNNKTN